MKKAKRIFTILMALIVFISSMAASDITVKAAEETQETDIKVFRSQIGMEEHIVPITRLRGVISIMVSVRGMRGEEHMN